MLDHVLTRALLAWLLFIPFAYFVERHILFNVLIGITLSLTVAILVGFTPGILGAIRQGEKLTRAHYLVLGIACTWFGILLYGSALWLWRNAGRPDTIIDHVFTAFAIYMTICGALLHLAAYETIDGTLPTRYWIRAGAIAAGAVGLAYILVTFGERTPPFTRLVGKLQPQEVVRGESARVVYKITKSTRPDCPGTVQQEIVDSQNTIFSKLTRAVGPASIEPDPDDPERYDTLVGQPVVIPAQAHPGFATFRTVTFRYCTKLQQLFHWPIVQIGPDIRFRILAEP